MHLAYVSAVALGSNPAVPQQLQQKLEPPPTSYSTTPAPPHLYMTKSSTAPLLLPHPLPDSPVAFECEKPLMCGSGGGRH